MPHWSDTYPHEIHASVILKANKIKIWKVGQAKLKEKYQIDSLVKNRHDYSYQENTWTVNNNEEHNEVFETLSTNWFRQWEVSEEIQGSSPFDSDNILKEFTRRRTVEERVFICPTCKMSKHQEGSQFCSNSFHLDTPEGYKMVQGRLEKI